MKGAGSVEGEHDSLRAAAELVGRLLLREVDAADLEALRDPRLAEALRDAGVSLPAPDDQAAWLEERAADYHELFLAPGQAGPPVQSLWSQGRFEGDAMVRVRELARAAGLELDREAARGAAPDHLGNLLLLWSRTVETARPIADEIAAEHLAWSRAPLAQVARSGGFYGAVADLAVALVDALGEAARPER